MDETVCSACRDRWPDDPLLWEYKRFRSTASFSEEARNMRTREEGKAFISRGPVLWRMRVKKLHEWYREHRHCNFVEETSLPDEFLDATQYGEPPF